MFASRKSIIARPAEARSVAAKAVRRSAACLGPPAPPLRLLGLQRTIGNQAVGELLGDLSRSAASNARPLRRLHINQAPNLNALAAAPAFGLTSQLKYNQAGRSHTTEIDMETWEWQLGHVPDRPAAIAAERNWLAQHGPTIGGANGANIAKMVRPANAHAAGAKQAELGGWYQLEEPNKYWPFVLRLSSTYGDANAARVVVVIFDHDKYGYITQIIDGGTSFNMPTPSPMFGNLFGGEEEVQPWVYSSQHAVDPNRDIAAQAAAMQTKLDADDQTKLIAEGARWQAVAAKAATGQLRDDSRFYPLTNAGDAAWGAAEQVPYVTLAKLWTTWNKFGRAWNVTDQALKNRLLNVANLRSGTDTLANLQNDQKNHGV